MQCQNFGSGVGSCGVTSQKNQRDKIFDLGQQSSVRQNMYSNSQQVTGDFTIDGADPLHLLIRGLQIWWSTIGVTEPLHCVKVEDLPWLNGWCLGLSWYFEVTMPKWDVTRRIWDNQGRRMAWWICQAKLTSKRCPGCPPSFAYFLRTSPTLYTGVKDLRDDSKHLLRLSSLTDTFVCAFKIYRNEIKNLTVLFYPIMEYIQISPFPSISAQTTGAPNPWWASEIRCAP